MQAVQAGISNPLIRVRNLFVSWLFDCRFILNLVYMGTVTMPISK